PGRGRVRPAGEAAAALEAARLPREVRAAAAVGALAAAVDRLAAQGHVPRPARLLPPRRRRRHLRQRLRGPAVQPGVAAADRLLRRRGGGVLAEALPPPAALVVPADHRRDGSGGRLRHPAVAPHLHRRQPGGLARVFAYTLQAAADGDPGGVILPP